jgi:hypothetical protein
MVLIPGRGSSGMLYVVSQELVEAVWSTHSRASMCIEGAPRTPLPTQVPENRRMMDYEVANNK